MKKYELGLVYIILLIMLLGCGKEEDSKPIIEDVLPEKIFNGSLENPSLEELETFFNNKYTIITGDVSFQYLDHIADLKFLKNINEIHGDLLLIRLPLENIDGLENLNLLSGRLFLMHLEITSLKALSNLKIIGGSMYFEHLNISNFDGLQNILKVDNINLYDLRIESLLGLDGLQEINSGLNISGCEQLKSLGNLENLERINGQTSIVGNQSLNTLGCFEKMNTLNGSLRISNNPSLNSLEGLSNIEYIKDDLKISRMSFENFDGLKNLKIIEGDFEIEENLNLKSIMSESSLIKIGGILEIHYNNSLINLQGLGSIDSIKGGCWVYRNQGLNSLNGINPNIRYSYYLTINENESLTDFCAISDYIISQSDTVYYSALYNAYNPEFQDFLDGNCSD